MKTLEKSKFILKDSLTDKEKSEVENRFLSSKNLEKLTIYKVLERQRDKYLQSV